MYNAVLLCDRNAGSWKWKLFISTKNPPLLILLQLLAKIVGVELVILVRTEQNKKKYNFFGHRAILLFFTISTLCNVGSFDSQGFSHYWQ